ncbi:short-chain dehydrogenase [Pseudonocardia sp. TMWB2A]|uniref:SDR family NAD(P)-dependent oxidoreductase n=1 Tax=Pseudonocardia sp. TMWB2A TaxID=687430 RepID=UPI00307DDD10
MTDFTGRVALVTGAASGIGAAITARLHAAGASVLLADIDAGRLAAGPSGERLRTAVTDVTRAADVEAACAAAVEAFGGLDLVFNVAGAARLGTVLDGEEGDWRSTVDLVLGGTYLGIRYGGRAIRDTGRGGAIVNVASLNAHVPLYGGSSYAAGKAGVEMLTKNAALELARHGIRVNAVLPGLVRTPLTAGWFDGGPVEQDFAARILAGRPADPDELAGPAVFLAGPDASYVNGTSLVVDGGWEITNYPDISAAVPS